MDNPLLTVAPDGTHCFRFPATGNAVEVYPTPAGDHFVTIYPSGASPITKRADLNDATDRIRLTYALNGHAAAMEEELIAVAALLAEPTGTRALAPAWPADDAHADLAHEVARLRAERDALRDKLARMENVHSLVMQALANPDLKTEAWTLVRAVLAAEAAWAATPEADRPADGFVRVSVAAITHAGDHPSRSHDAASKHLQRGHTWGLIEREVRTGSKAEETVDRDTGEIIVTHRPIKQQYLRATGDVLTALERLADFKRTEPANHGGARTACAKCGSAQVSVTVRCQGCGGVLSHDGVRPGATPPEPSEPGPPPDDASCGYGETRPGGGTDRAGSAAGPRRALDEKDARCVYGTPEAEPGDDPAQLDLLDDPFSPRCERCYSVLPPGHSYWCGDCLPEVEAEAALSEPSWPAGLEEGP
ncbi:MAG: hypothetical protein M3Q03_06420 [Chloroflexota bacterium]|nr:hypothetical protein [Chloroflexota bacterium]